MAWTFCTSGAAIAKAGANANAVIVADSTSLAEFSDEAEGYIEQQTNTDYTTNYSTISTSMKNALKEVTSSMIALKIANYEITAYSNSREGETVLDFNTDIVNKGLAALKGKADTLKNP